ncbi:MAG TPA: hypothetical protein VNJ29_00775 [Candidatus Nitrosotenuis sp.]|jgi:hypothetical protein|nr:hypothetical protein [Candidatus Nitrosotenuis sp.]
MFGLSNHITHHITQLTLVMVTFFILSNSLPGNSMESQNSNENQIPQLDEFTSQGEFSTYAKQFNYYRQIYNNAINDPNLTFSTTHIEGLFHILEYGFAKTQNFIKTTKGKNKSTALSELNTLYMLASRLEKDEKLSQQRFIAINLFMAAIVDRYKGITEEDNHYLARFYPKVIEKALKTGNLAEFSARADFVPMNPRQPFVAIIYKGKSHISPNTFVDQLFHKDYGLGIALFDAESLPYAMTQGAKEKSGTKLDPHYSQFNTTVGLLKHDFSHIKEQAEKERYFSQNYGLNVSKELKKVNEIRLLLKERDLNDYQILTNGLFILSHELFNVSAWIKYKSLPKPLTFIHLLQAIKESMQTAVEIFPRLESKSSSFTKDELALALKYKQDFRDHEEILKNVKDKDGNFLKPPKDDWSKLSATQKTKTIVEAYEKFWNYFIEIIKNHSQ